jgi:hypothetical protein
MQAITTVGLDIAKSVFQVHGVDAAGKVIIRRKLTRRYVLPFFQRLPTCVVGIEACATSHHWSRETPRASPGQVRNGDQPEGCQGDRSRDFGRASRPRRRGDRMTMPRRCMSPKLAPKRPAIRADQCLLVAHQQTCRGHHPTAQFGPLPDMGRS